MFWSFGRRAFSLGAVGGFGAVEVGGLGAEPRDVSGSEMEDESRSAPVSTPLTVFFSFGMPTPANIPPNCGAEGTPLESPLVPLPPVSLLLRTRFDAASFITGARPLGFVTPGIAGAPVRGPVEEGFVFSSCGADRSFVTAFLSLVPLVISPSKAPFLKYISNYLYIYAQN